MATVVALLMAMRWPFRVLRRLALRDRLRLTLSVLAALATVSLLEKPAAATARGTWRS